MMKSLKYFLFLFYFVFFGVNLATLAQNNTIGMRGRAYNNKIMLRWAPNSILSWKQGNTFGYKITRKTLNASNQVISTTIFNVNPGPIGSWVAYKDSSYYDALYDGLYDNGFVSNQDSLKQALKTLQNQLFTLERNINQSRITVGDSNKTALDTISLPSFTDFLSKVKNNHTISEKRLNYFIQFLNTNNNTSLNSQIASYQSSINELYANIFGFSVQTSDDDFAFAFAVSSADLKYNAAKLAGLGYEDLTVVQGQKYRYIVKVNVVAGARTTAPTDPIVVGQDSIDIVTSFSALPAIPKPFIKFEENKNVIRWHYKSLKTYYGSYFVERKEQGSSTYTRITPEPIILPGGVLDSLYYIDKVPNVTKQYYYRIVGRSYFDELVYSPDESITTQKNYSVIPMIQSIKKKTNISHEIIWKFPSDNSVFPQDSLSHYSIFVSNFSDSAFTKLNSTNILKSITAYDISHSLLLSKVDTMRSYYFKVVAHTIDGVSLNSLPYIMIPKDKIPPASPANVIVAQQVTDSTDNKYLVRISWTINTEPDLEGYQVFRIIGDQTEMTDISGGIISNTMTVDTLSKTMTYPQIKYLVYAYDNNYNRSEASTITFKKPDSRPPISPIITGYTVQGSNVNLEFQQSNATDLKEHTILRKDLNNAASNWDIVTVIPSNDKTQTYLDNTTVGGNTYVYTMFSVDSSGNKSCFNPSTQLSEDCYQLVVVSLKNIKKPVVDNFTAKLDSASNMILLSWEYTSNPELENFELFRTEDTTSVNNLTTNPSLWKLANLFDRTTIDEQFAYGKKLKYMIRAAYKDGSISDFSSVTLLIPNSTICNGLAWIFLNALLKPTNPQLIEACEQVVLEEGFGAEASDTGSIEIKTKQ